MALCELEWCCAVFVAKPQKGAGSGVAPGIHGLIVIADGDDLDLVCQELEQADFRRIQVLELVDDEDI